jgi:hypothetical protein
MKTTLPLANHHPLRKSSIAFLIASLTAPLLAGPVKFVFLSKDIDYQQTSAKRVTVLPGDWLPYSFAAEVDGDDRSSVALLSPKPSIKLPANSKFVKLYNEKPSLGLGSDDDDGWNFGYVGHEDFDNWGTSTKAEIDQAFPNGNYVFTVEGKTINLSLPRDSYPTAPKLTLTGGRWMGGAYRIKSNQTFTINSGTYTRYGTNLNDFLELGLENDSTGEDIFEQIQVAKKLAGGPPVSTAKFITKRIPANTLKAGDTYYLSAGYGAIVSQSSALPGATAVATYGVHTEVKVIVERP